MSAQILASEYSNPINAEHGWYVQVRVPRGENAHTVARAAANVEAEQAGFRPHGRTRMGFPVSAGSDVTYAVWYFDAPQEVRERCYAELARRREARIAAHAARQGH